ncbi:unnamed protein product [Lactuca virosa]|uniref:Bulb-type lectin domain-containing protein n=1 Tax=Lactuca virosa TaxID=75947 RepID=A0AAU9NT47_9ASTR|nr:unnamed protein product [Lactuca virosa]
MRAPWICSFFFAFFLIFSSNTEFHSCSQKTNPPVLPNPYFRIPSPLMPVSGPVIYVRYPPNTLQPLPKANLSTTWTNDESSIPSINFTDGSRIRVILDKEKFACGFFCFGNCTSYLFAIVIKISYSPGYIFGTKGNPTVIWSANRDNSVKEGAILNFTAAGELVLHDVDGSIVWTTNTGGKSTAGMNLTDKGNLMLFDGYNSMVWQSFDHPTDCLVAGQKLLQGQKLIPSVSSTNWMAQKDSYYLQLTDSGLFAYVQSNPPQVYYKRLINVTKTNKERIYIELLNGSLCFFNSSTKFDSIDIPQEIPLEYTKLMPDGHLKAFGGEMVADLLTEYDFGDCSYPLACGRNAICSGDVQCSCPKSSSPVTEYFRAVDDSQPNKGCSEVTPLTCNATQDQHFIELKNIKYFTYTANMEHVDMETCKQACLNNCSCKAAIFEYLGSNSSSGYCDLPSELFSMTNFDVDANNQVHASAFIKVQNGRYKSPKRKNHVTTILGSTVGSLVLLVILVVVFTKFIGQKEEVNGEMEEEYLDKVPGMPTRYSKDMQEHGTEVVEMMKVVSWCLQIDYTKRPSMSSVVKVIEGVMDVESNLDYNFLWTISMQKITNGYEKRSKPMSASILSGPR